MPGVIGGQLTGVIRTSAKVRPEEGFRLALNCVQKVTHGEDTSETTLWQDEQIIARDLLQDDFERSAIPVLFQIPYESCPTDETNTYNKTTWRLDVSARRQASITRRALRCRCSRRPRATLIFVADRNLIAEYAAPEDPDRRPPRCGRGEDGVAHRRRLPAGFSDGSRSHHGGRGHSVGASLWRSAVFCLLHARRSSGSPRSLAPSSSGDLDCFS